MVFHNHFTGVRKMVGYVYFFWIPIPLRYATAGDDELRKQKPTQIKGGYRLSLQ